MDNQDDGTRIYNVLEIRDLSIIADIKATNPGFSTHTYEYMENCQRCVVAYEARRRGYNVVAKPRILSSTDPLPYMTNPLGWPKCRYGCVSVFDIYRLFDINSFSINRMMIILAFNKRFLAFSTEQVDGVVNVSHEKIYDIPSMLNNASRRYMKKIIVLDNHLVPIIDTARLFEKAGVLEETELILQ